VEEVAAVARSDSVHSSRESRPLPEGAHADGVPHTPVTGASVFRHTATCRKVRKKQEPPQGQGDEPHCCTQR